MEDAPISYLILTNTEPLGLSLIRAVRTAAGNDVPAFAMTYAESIVLLNPQRIEETDFFILDLFRDYPGGRRAEGIVLAERWLHRKPFLVISPLYLAEKISCPGYWDISSSDSLIDRIIHIASSPHLCIEGFEVLKNRFTQLLTLPPQH